MAHDREPEAETAELRAGGLAAAVEDVRQQPGVMPRPVSRTPMQTRVAGAFVSFAANRARRSNSSSGGESSRPVARTAARRFGSWTVMG
jgi:hypothetical protein